MIIHTVCAEKKSGELAKEEQLAWKLAEIAFNAKDIELDADVKDMVKNRLIDNAAIALAALNELPIQVARAKALASEGMGKATLMGLPSKTVGVSQAAFANASAVRFRDQDDTYLAAEYSHPDDNISPILAVAQQLGASGEDVLRGIAVAYEIHVALVGTGNETGINLYHHKVDHMTHIAAATAAGIGSMLALPKEQIYHAINFAVHNAISSRQSRKGDIGAQKEFVPGFSAEISIEAVHNAMHGLKGPNPVYEGVDSIIRRFLNGKNDDNATYKVELVEPGKDKMRNILRTYPKEHAFEYQGQAIIDMALEMREKLPKKDDGKIDFSKVSNILLETSHHTHHVIGTDANDPQKIDPDSPRGTLDHSIMFAIARSMQLGRWDEDVYNIPQDEKAELRAIMEKIQTAFDQKWEDRYHSTDPNEQAFGGRIIITLADGEKIEDEKAVANAHPLGSTPWKRPNYIDKLEKLTKAIMSDGAREAFIASVEKLEQLPSARLRELTPPADMISLELPKTTGIYDAKPVSNGAASSQ
ncbi:MAG: MmgE/PrpD family protein [Rickettsiales bacterium]